MGKIIFQPNKKHLEIFILFKSFHPPALSCIFTDSTKGSQTFTCHCRYIYLLFIHSTINIIFFVEQEFLQCRGERKGAHELWVIQFSQCHTTPDNQPGLVFQRAWLPKDVTDIGPLLLSLQNKLQFRADVHMIHVIQECQHSPPRQVCHPCHAYKLAKLKIRIDCIIRPHLNKYSPKMNCDHFMHC